MSYIKKDIEDWLRNLISSEVDTGKGASDKAEFRASSLPYCSILDLKDRVDRKEHKEKYVDDPRPRDKDKMNWGGMYYTRVGTTVHSLLQGTSANISSWQKYFYGGWVCDECGAASTEHDPIFRKDFQHCHKDCKSHLTYEEIGLSYRGLSGHVDGVLFHPKYGWILLEWKTTGNTLFTNPRMVEKYFPQAKHIAQAETYCYILYQQYNIKISYYVILYVNRDKQDGTLGKSIRPFIREWNTLRKKHRKNVFYKESTTRSLLDRHWHEAKVDKKIRRSLAEKMLDLRPCKSIDDFNRTMKAQYFGQEVCPHLKQCTGGSSGCQKILQQVEKWLKESS